MKIDKIDRRSKEWKSMSKADRDAYTNLTKSEGLGDTVEKIMDKTGVKSVVKALFGDDCGCDERKEKLNKMFKYRGKMECLTESEFNYLDRFFKANKSRVTPTEQGILLGIFNRVFNEKHKQSNCGACWRAIIQKIRKVYDEYQSELIIKE